MFKHIVSWEFAKEDKAKHLIEMKTLLETLPALIPEISEYEIGLNVRESELAMDMDMVSAFSDEAAFKIYSTHPEHRRVVEALHKVTTNAVIVDYNT